MEPLIFISYLRSTGRSDARAVSLQLKRSFNAAEIFFDREPDDIPINSRWREDIAQALTTTQVVLAIVDPEWEHVMSNYGRTLMTMRRGKRPYMCTELAMAVELEKPVIPLLLGGAPLPDARRLPEGARQAFEQGFQAAEISETFWEESFTRLVPTLKKICVESRQREIVFESELLESSSIASSVLNIKDPEDRARHKLQQKMQMSAELAMQLEALQLYRRDAIKNALGNIK